jgi:hypothetical protein
VTVASDAQSPVVSIIDRVHTVMRADACPASWTDFGSMWKVSKGSIGATGSVLQLAQGVMLDGQAAELMFRHDAGVNESR